MAAETYDPAGFHEPAAALTRRRDRQFDTALAAVLGVCLGILACAGLILTHPAPTCGASTQIAER